MDTKIITKEAFDLLNDKDPVQGYALIRSYQTLSKNTTYIDGILESIGAIKFKVWNTANAFKVLSDADLSNHIVKIAGVVNDYNGVRSILINDVSSDGIPAELQSEDFYEKKYDAEALYAKLVEVLEHNCSEASMNCFNTLIGAYGPKFKKEFAAISHHDNCLNGLLAHSLKVTRLVQIVKFYPELCKHLDLDLLFLGAAIHDIGKVLEYDAGSISEVGKLCSHTTLGLQILADYGPEFSEYLGSGRYQELLSIVQQHHGSYGEKPRTLSAYIIHLFDALEASITSVEESASNSKNGQIYVDDIGYLKFKI